tara:strand:- start:16395 stop:16682 length:288 start_codon:yes stop_codon:yes gene_type:complete
MKLIKNASGKTQLKLSKSEWQKIGKEQGWIKKGQGIIPEAAPENWDGEGAIAPRDLQPIDDTGPTFAAQLREMASNLTRMADDVDSLQGKVKYTG